MKKINELLPKAMQALEDSGLIYQKKSILKEYDGYVASFAPSVITAGLKATLSFYTDKHKIKNSEELKPNFDERHKQEPRRYHILLVMHQIYNKIETHIVGDDLLTIALNANTAELPQLKRDLMSCAIALKLVMRNFNQIESIPPKPKSKTP